MSLSSTAEINSSQHHKWLLSISFPGILCKLCDNWRKRRTGLRIHRQDYSQLENLTKDFELIRRPKDYSPINHTGPRCNQSCSVRLWKHFWGSISIITIWHLCTWKIWKALYWRRPRNYQREDDRSVQSVVGSVIVMMAVLFLEIVLKVTSPARHCLYQWTINIFECISFGLNMAGGNILNARAVTILFIGYLEQWTSLQRRSK